MSEMTRRSFLAAAGAATLAAGTRAVSPASKAKFQLGIVTYNVPKDWDLPTLLSVCKDVGIAAVECRTTHKHGVEPTLTADQRKSVKQQFADSGVRFLSCGSTCEFHSPDAAVVKKQIEECKAFIQLVADLGGKGVKVRPNGVSKGHTVEQACEQIGKALQECGKAAESAGVEIWVEVHGAVTQIPKNMKTIMDACGHKAVGVTWNSNPTDVANGSIAENFELLAKHIKCCHINDLVNDKAGKYPYRELFKKLAGIDYDRYTLCEVGKAYTPEEGKTFLQGYKKLWDELVNG
ncbi:sugar phosphate isomerase/epimerase family protein [Limnoglobus roseus]|uniref:Sugar phosphate isomerase/epimerase n=1 Tax=Limnoglobus roseus TaxID=2598579 RepID=A0A5C1AS58_9BACT|nr:sugar phosphate isomerase/epimerase family protein [Limnoglobus roseus]QEL20064.1 sugar phosphate isomerase/epimerase [Limnoglobus roseus]